jgi:AraC-like DNA-binding protein
MTLDSTVSVLTARPVVAALEERGIDADRVLRVAELSREALASIENRLPHRSVGTLWEAAAEAAHDASFGVHVAETLPAGAYDVLEYLFSTAETVGAGFSRLARYIPLVHDHGTLELVVEPDLGRLVRRVPVIAPQYDEFSMTILLVRSRQASGVPWSPARAGLQHERAPDDGELARVFGCPVVFGAAETEMQIPAAVLALPHAHADSKLFAVLCRHADSLLESTMTEHGSLLSRVSSAITRRMATELPTLATTATAVRIPERTLQRRLAEEGVSHSALVDDVRRALAVRYLGSANVSVTEIAYMLHFADPTVFSRAFKRWTGVSPAAYRKRLF